MAARRRLGILQSCPAVLQSRLGILQFCLSILQSRPVSPQSSPLSFLSPGSQLRSASRSFHGTDPAGSDEVSRALHGIGPVATAEAPVAHRRIAPLLPPKSHVSFAGFAPLRRFCSLQKQKSRHFATFCDYGLPPSLKREIGPQHSWITCVLRLNPQLEGSK